MAEWPFRVVVHGVGSQDRWADTSNKQVTVKQVVQVSVLCGFVAWAVPYGPAQATKLPETGTIISPEAIFLRARAAIADAPAALGPALMASVAIQEQASEPRQALRDLQSAFKALQDLPAPVPGDESSEAAAAERGVTESLIIAHMAGVGEIDRALELANQMDLGATGKRGPVYSWILEAMAQHGKLDRVSEAVQQCVQADGSFPYAGVVALIKSDKLDSAMATALALEGIANAANRSGVMEINAGAMFLIDLHSVAPSRDSHIEDAAIAMLGSLRSAAPSSAFERRSEATTAYELLAVVEAIDPGRTRDLRSAFPEGAVPPPSGLRLQTDEYGRVTPTFVPDAATRLAQEAEKDPDQALKQASQGTDYDLRFRALVAIAAALGKSDRRQAAVAADSALGLLREHHDLMGGEINSAVGLAGTLAVLGEKGSAAELIGQCLDEADRLAARAEQQFDAMPPLRQARALGQLTLLAVPIVHTYDVAGGLAPALALRHALAMRSSLLKPAVLAHLAAGMAAAAPAEPLP